MITIGSGTSSIQIYSPKLQSFQKDCLLLEQIEQNDLFRFRISYIPEDNGAKIHHDAESITEAMEVFWKILIRNFAAISCQTENKILFLAQEGRSIKKIVNCSWDLKKIFGGSPCGYSFDELIEQQDNLRHLCSFCSLDGQPTQEKFQLEKDLLARFKDQSFWSYRFSAKRINEPANMAQHQPPIPSIG